MFSACSHAWISQLINSTLPFTTFMTLQLSEDVKEKTKKAIESWWPSLELLNEILFSWKLNDTYRSYITRKSLEHQVVAGMVTRVRTVNSHNNSTIKIPVANRLRYPLAFNVGRTWRKPCVLSLCLAMSKTWIYKQSIFLQPWEASYSIEHLISETLKKTNLWSSAACIVFSASIPVSMMISWGRS